jgi:hypothetical protein
MVQKTSNVKRNTPDAGWLQCVLLCAFVAWVAGCKAPQMHISRGFQQFQLGMSFEELARVSQPVATEDPAVKVYKEFGFGDPKQQEEIDRTLERKFFEVTQGLSPDLDRVTCYFYRNRLYYLALGYKEAYTHDVDWDHFTAASLLKYGSPLIAINIEDAPYFSYTWRDGETELEIRKVVNQEKGSTRFVVRSYVVAFSDIRDYAEVAKQEKSLEKTATTGHPSF